MVDPDDGDIPASRSNSNSKRAASMFKSMASIKVNSVIFESMARFPWPWMLVLPVIFAILAGAGWSQDDIVETQVANIWTATSGDYYQDKQYRLSLLPPGNSARGGSSSFAAVASSRDGTNIFTPHRLEEIRTRMEAAESATVEHNGETFTYQDWCASNNAGLNTVYKFPCVRLSPMDYFQEARWFFDETDKLTFYSSVIQEQLVKPRIKRFGTMTQTCMSTGATTQGDFCDDLYNSRVQAGETLLLFADLGNLGMEDPCKICVESGFEESMEQLTFFVTSLFQVLAAETQKVATDPSNPNAANAQASLANLGVILQSMDREAVEDFYLHYVTRSLYATLGAEDYVNNYAAFMKGLGPVCDGTKAATQSPVDCARTVDLETAFANLLAHADHEFSSYNTAGFPFSFYSANGLSPLFFGNEPVGGSGINMGGTLLSATAYLDLGNYGTTDWKPLYANGETLDSWGGDPLWNAYVETDPVYNWFMGSVRPLTSHCGNEDLKGTPEGTTGADTIAGVMAQSTSRWCTQYNTPFEVDKELTQQHFAKMWYQLLVDSTSFLGITQGESDPYTWTTGQGCPYELRGERPKYTNATEEEVLLIASTELYYIDEGVSVGAIDRRLLIGGANPPVGDYNVENPLKSASSFQNIYISTSPEGIQNRVKNCNRPGGPIDLSYEDAEELLIKFKEEFEEVWSAGWDDKNAGDVQFVGFFDDVGVIGTTGRMLEEITLAGGTLMGISFVIIAVFSALFLASADLVESRALLSLLGVGLVLLSFFAALGLAILIGIKINITIGWTLPFILIGLGVDDMYIVILALKKNQDRSTESFVAIMKDIIVPVSMTSLVNASMFAIMNISDIPAIYETARAGLIAICFLYIVIIFCFPAYCYLDMIRQRQRRCDVLFCIKSKAEPLGESERNSAKRSGRLMYEAFYKPIMITSGPIRTISHISIFAITLVLGAISIWGVTRGKVGLGLELFFPADNQANRWATIRTEDLASWSVNMYWGELDYRDPKEQMGMIKQFEDVVATPYISDLGTDSLWIADFNIWTTRQCTSNFVRSDVDQLQCGADFTYKEEGTCSGTWKRNDIDLRLFAPADSDTCGASNGICRPLSIMHPYDLQELAMAGEFIPGIDDASTYCPVFEDWSEGKFKFCLENWRSYAGGGGGLIIESDTATENPDCDGEFMPDANVVSPIKLSNGPSMYAYDLNSHEDTVDMIKQTRAFCDKHPTLHCWMTGIPYDYWEQYIWVKDVLVEIIAAAIGIGFAVSFLFLFIKLGKQGFHGIGSVAAGSLVGALLIALTCFLSVFLVIGLSSLANVTYTAFSVMSYVLSVGFAVEYSVHIIHRFLEAPQTVATAVDRVEYAMSFLFLPTFMSFVSSTIGVATLAFTEFQFNDIFFFRPLIIVMFMTYFIGVYFLPAFLCLFDFEFMKLGPNRHMPGIETSMPAKKSWDDDVMDDDIEAEA